MHRRSPPVFSRDGRQGARLSGAFGQSGRGLTYFAVASESSYDRPARTTCPTALYPLRMARSMSRFMLFCFRFSRLSYNLRPLQMPISTLARPSLKYIFKGTRVSPFS
jgi:hypothetical protein